MVEYLTWLLDWLIDAWREGKLSLASVDQIFEGGGRKEGGIECAGMFGDILS